MEDKEFTFIATVRLTGWGKTEREAKDAATDELLGDLLDFVDIRLATSEEAEA